MFGANIKQLRLLKGLSQKELAAETDININTLASYEKGTREPNFDTLVKFAKYFDCTTDYLLGLSNTRNIETQKIDNLTLDEFIKKIIGIKGGIQFVRKMLRLMKTENVETVIASGDRIVDVLYYAITALNDIEHSIKSSGDADSDLIYEKISRLLKCRQLFAFAIDDLYNLIADDIKVTVKTFCKSSESRAFASFENLFRYPDSHIVSNIKELLDDLDEGQSNSRKSEGDTNADTQE